jgi:mannose-6-phosphate isomerase-like protein (cupin superfamily)
MQRLNRRTLLSAFGVASMAPLLTSGCLHASTSTRRVAVVQRGGNRFPYSTESMQKGAACRLTADDSAGGCSAFELVALARGGPGLHVHHREDEWYYVLAGNFLFDAGQDRYELPAGASIFLPRDIPHRWANTSVTDEGRLILVCQPGGFEKFFEELGKLPMAPTGAELKLLHELHERFGMEMLGPPIFA